MQQPDPVNTSQAAARTSWQLGFGVVRHTRKHPVKNSFSYRSFFVEGDASTLLSEPAGDWLFGVNKRALMSIRVEDHGNGKSNLDWLDEMLASANLPKASTIRFRGFPRVFGYAFKPVSFWFCANNAGEDFAIVAEVNNTFGERHCYLLSNPGGARIKNGQLLTATKAFHVSPFRKIVGRYQFRFIRKNAQSTASIDHHENSTDVLQTSISGAHVPLSRATCLRAIFGYPFFTFGVVGRIHWQAVRLWIKRVPFVSRPLPPNQFVTPGSNLKEE